MHPLRLIGMLALALGCHAAQAACLSDSCIDLDVSDEAITSGSGATVPAGLVRSVVVEGGWRDRIALPLASCTPLTRENLFVAMNVLRAAIMKNRMALADAAEVVEILHVDVRLERFPRDAQVCAGAAETVSVSLRPYHVRLPTDPGSNLLALPRSALASPADEPAWVTRVLRPQVGMAHDRAFGSSLTASIQPRFDPGEQGAPGGAVSVEPFVQLRKSVDADYFDVDGATQFRFRTTGPWLREYRMHVGGSQSREPLGDGRLSRHTVEIGGGVTLRPLFATRLFLDGALSRSGERLVRAEGAARDDARALTARAVLDYLPQETTGLLRGALWHGNHMGSGDARYRQWVARVGYTQEIGLSRPGQALGVELVAGAGKLWGNAPDGGRYFGGNSPVQFLHDNALSPEMLAVPRGPLIRSFGQAQAGLGIASSSQGGSAFWHINLTLALPVARWSRPLIPDELTDLTDVNGKPVSLKQILNTQVDRTGPAMLEATLVGKGVSPEEARRQASEAFAEVQPAAHFIVNEANLYAVRPLVMIDAGGLSAARRSARWLAVGGGIGVTLVTARFEAGYMQTVMAPAAERKNGALFARLVFENIFR